MNKPENLRRYLHTSCTETKTRTLEVVNRVLDASNGVKKTSGVYYQKSVTGERRGTAMRVFKGRKARQKIGSHKQERAHSHQQTRPKDYTEQRRNHTTHDKTLPSKSFHKVNTRPDPIPCEHIF